MKIFNRSWFLLAIAAGFCWGVWGVISKFISGDVSPFLTHLLFSVGMIATIPFVIRKCNTKNLNRKGLLYGITGAVFAIGGNIAIYYAFTKGGNASIVVPLTNLYPLVTIVIALIILKEKLNGINVLGFFLVLPAIVLLSGYSELFTDPDTFFRILKLQNWLWYSLIAFVCWGLFSIAQKITTNYLSAEWSYFVFIIVSIVISAFFIFSNMIEKVPSTKEFTLGSIAGLLNGLGVLSALQLTGLRGRRQP